MGMMDNDVEEILIDQETLQNRIKQLGEKISKDYAGKDLILICVLKGAILFMADLAQNIDIPLEMDFMDVSSYGDSAQSSGVVKIIKDLDTNIEGRDLLIVEDIVDSGLTLSYLVDLLKGREVKSLKICSLLDKPTGRIGQVEIDYTGFEVPDAFVVGYGLDYAEKYRNLPYIGILKEEIYKG